MAPSGSEQAIHPESRDYSGFDPFRPEISLVRTDAPGEPLSGLGANTTHRVGGGLWAAGAAKFPCPGRKPSGGAFIRLLGANAAHSGRCGRTSMFGNESSLRDRLFGLYGRIGFDRVLAPRDMGCGSPSTSFMANSGAPPPPWSKRLVFTCNMYSPAYKGKSSKKRLSPKQVNTLIHQCIAFYKTFIFQYLSLWKSVFSCN